MLLVLGQYSQGLRRLKFSHSPQCIFLGTLIKQSINSPSLFSLFGSSLIAQKLKKRVTTSKGCSLSPAGDSCQSSLVRISCTFSLQNPGERVHTGQAEPEINVLLKGNIMSIEGNKWLDSACRNDKILRYYLPPQHPLPPANAILNTFNRLKLRGPAAEHSSCVFFNFLVNIYVCDTLNILCMVP